MAKSSRCESIFHGWKTVLGLFLQTGIAMGTIKSIGVYFSEMQASIGTTGTDVGLILGLFSGFIYGTGPFVTYLYRKDFCRRYVFVTGSVLSSLSLIFGSLVSSSRQLAVCLSLAGIGGGILSVCCTLTIREKDGKNFQLLYGLGKSGYSVGMILMPLLADYLMSIYGWRGSMMIIGALVGNIIPLTLSTDVAKGERDELDATSMRSEEIDSFTGNEPKGEPMGIAKCDEHHELCDVDKDEKSGTTNVSIDDEEPTIESKELAKCDLNREIGMSDKYEKGNGFTRLEHKQDGLGADLNEHEIGSHGSCSHERKTSRTNENENEAMQNQNKSSFKAVFTNLHQGVKSIISRVDPWMFVFFVIANFGGMVSGGWHAFLIPRAVSLGIPLSSAIYLLYPASIACFFGRFFSGILQKYKCLSSVDLYLLIKVCDALSLLVDVLVPIFSLKYVSTFINAFCIAEVNMLNVFICEEHTSSPIFPFIYALFLVSHGSGTLIGTYLTGLIADLTGNYNTSYMLIAALDGVIISFTILLRYIFSRNKEAK